MQVRIVKKSTCFVAHIFINNEWHYLQTTAAWTRYGCIKKAMKYFDNQKLYDHNLFMSNPKIVLQYEIQ